MVLLTYLACTASPPNVLVIVLDDVGPEKLTSFGTWLSQPATPNLDALAERGVRFTRAYAHPVCSPTRAAALTGRYPRRHGVGEVLRSGDELPLASELIGEALGRADDQWARVALGKWHLATTSSATGMDHPNLQGFDAFAGSMGNISDYSSWRKVEDGASAPAGTYATVDTTDDALAILPDLPSPWFAWVAYHAAHIPFHTPPGDLYAGPPPDETSDVERFNAMVEAMDTEIGRLLDGVSHRVARNTTVVVLGDNGVEAEVVTAPFQRVRSKVSVFEGGVRIPLIVASPEVARPGSSSDALVHVVDLFPTVLELARIDAVPQELDGYSLLPHLRDPDLDGMREVVYTERMVPAGPPPYFRDHRTVRDDTHKLIARKDPGFDERLQLFRFGDGPDEGDDLLESGDALAAEDADALARLSDALRGFEALPYEGR